MRMIAGHTPGWLDHVVYLDGKLLDRCFLADEEQGIAQCFATDENGQLIPSLDGGLETVKHTGVVEIRPKGVSAWQE